MKRTKHIQSSRRSRVVQDIISAVLILYSLITVFLVGDTVLSSFKTKSELIKNLIGFPQSPTLHNYATVFLEESFWRYILNSGLLVFTSLLFLLIVASMIAYGMAQYSFRGKGFLRGYLLLGLMMPVQLSILPLYLMMSKVNLTNNMWGLAIVYAANLSFSFVVFYRFFQEISVSIIESARIDGAHDLRIFGEIIIPISKPVFATIGLLQFIMIWNDFFLPMVFLTHKGSQTLTLAIYSYTDNFIKNWDKIFAAVTVALIPILIVYFLFSEQIISGLMAGSTKE